MQPTALKAMAQLGVGVALLFLSALPANADGNSGVPDLVCYIQLPGDRLVNLSSLCNQLQPPAKQDVVVTEIRIAGNSVVGRVRNDTGKPLQRIIINYEVVSQNANPIRYKEFGFVQPDGLAPGQTGVFRGGLRSPGALQVTTVEWW